MEKALRSQPNLQVSSLITNQSAVEPYFLNGLVLAVDAGNLSSYPGSGTTWFDLSGNNNNGTFVGSISFQSTNGGVLQTANSSYINFPSPNLSSGQSTVIGVSRYSGALRGRIIAGRNNNWLLGHWSSSTQRYHPVGWVSQAGANDTNWRFYAGTGNTANDSWGLYVNDSLLAFNNGGSSGPNGFSIGAHVAASEFSNGQIGMLFAYSRVLESEEILRIFNWARNRFSL